MYKSVSKNPYYRAYKTAANVAGAYQAGLYATRLAYRGARAVASKYRKKAPNSSRIPKRARILKPKKTLKAVAKEVNNLKKKVAVMDTLYTKKYRSFGSVTASTNQTNYGVIALNSTSILEQVIDSVKYFNPSAPGTLINVDLSSPTYQQQVSFTKSYIKMRVRNNFSVPCYVDVYFLVCKKDTSITPDTAITNSIADMTNGALTTSSLYPSDCHDFLDLWSIKKHKRVYMPPGKELVYTGTVPVFKYDVSLSDSMTESYLKYIYGSFMMIRVEGIVGHGATSGVGCMQCGIDYEIRRTHTVCYNGGVNTEYIEVDESTQTISGTHQCSQLDSEQAAYAR